MLSHCDALTTFFQLHHDWIGVDKDTIERLVKELDGVADKVEAKLTTKT